MDESSIRKGVALGPEPWHMHPIVFLEAIAEHEICACNRDITIDELCLIAPKAKKNYLNSIFQHSTMALESFK